MRRFFAYAAVLSAGIPYKRAETREKRCFFTVGKCMIPHPEKAYKGGEDAFFVDESLLAVADGVGGWSSMGVDPGLYSKQLCSNIESLWRKQRNLYEDNPKRLIIDAAALTTQTGSSTCLILSLNREKTRLSSSFIGDSGYVLYKSRDGAYFPAFCAEEHSRSFNFPYQIGTHGDDPRIALQKSHENIGNGDILVVGTDGLFDNVHVEEITQIVNETEKNMEILAKKLAETAFSASNNPKKESPFERKAREAGLRFRGGKPDDITVITAKINVENP